MSSPWAVVPIKELAGAKQRLAAVLTPERRAALMLAMCEDVLAVLATTPGLAGVAVVTVDPAATALARRHGARVLQSGARDGQTCAVTAAGRALRAEGCAAMIALPGDIPLLTSSEVAEVLAAHGPAPCCTIVPSRDEGGSNAVLASPPGTVPLRYGENSFQRHLDAAARAGVPTQVLRLPGIGLDVDTPADLAELLRVRRPTGSTALLASWGFGFGWQPPDRLGAPNS